MKKTSHIPCIVCNRTPTDKCHIKSKGSGGGADAGNLLMMCRIHHIHQHQYGWCKFIEAYPQVGAVLSKMGYEITDVFGVQKLVKKCP